MVSNSRQRAHSLQLAVGSFKSFFHDSSGLETVPFFPVHIPKRKKNVKGFGVCSFCLQTFHESGATVYNVTSYNPV